MSLCSLGFKELRSVKSGERNGEVEVKTAVRHISFTFIDCASEDSKRSAAHVSAGS